MNNDLTFIPAIIGLVITLTVWTAIQMVIWSRAPQNIAGAVSLLCMAVTMIGYLYQMVLPEQEMALFWNRVMFAGSALLPLAWLAFVLLFSGFTKKLPRAWLVVAVISLTISVFMFIPTTQELVFRTASISRFGQFWIVDQKPGPLGMVYFAFIQVVLAGVTIMLGRVLKKTRPKFRLQILALILSPGFTWVAVGLKLVGINPIAPLSLVYFSATPTAIVVAWALFSLRSGKGMVTPRQVGIENIRDAMITLDADERISDLNRSARMLLQIEGNQGLGKPIKKYLPEWEEFFQFQPTGGATQPRHPFTITIQDFKYDARVSFLRDWKDDIVGSVLILANITEREELTALLQKQVADYEHLTALTRALSQVEAKVTASPDLDEIYQTMAAGLNKMGLQFFIALRSPDQDGYEIEYMSLSSGIIKQFEKFSRQKVKGFKLPDWNQMAQYGEHNQNESLYFADVVSPIHVLFADIPAFFEQTILKAIGLTAGISAFLFPLTLQNREIGALCLWGDQIRRDDHSAFSIFASQISSAMDKAKLYEKEFQRSQELQRTNNLMTALIQVAVRFDAALTLEEVMAIVGDELGKWKGQCLFAMLDEQTGELVGRYASTDQKTWRIGEKMTGVSALDVHIPQRLWKEIDPDATGNAKIIEDPLSIAHSVLSFIPRALLKQTMHMVGITKETPVIWMPLRAHDRMLGMMAVWGFAVLPSSLPILSLFARQVAVALEKASLVEDLRQLKTFNEGIVQGVAEAIVLVDHEGRISFANPAAGVLLGRPTEDLLGKGWRTFVAKSELDKIEVEYNGVFHGEEGIVETKVVRANEEIIPVLVSSKTQPGNGKNPVVLLAVTNILERVKAEEQVRASMLEKESLLKEIHHRVKNNLQIVSSLLNLQSRYLQSAEDLELFRESQNRIHSMALIHEKLYRSEDLSQIDFNEYLNDLANSLIRAYKGETRYVRLVLDTEPLTLGVDEAIPCGLIVNELVTNSLKHAFARHGAAQINPDSWIRIALNRQPDDQVSLLVADNGPGFPTDIDFQNTGSLGLQLVNSLTRQIDGQVSFTNRAGARVEVIFRKSNKFSDGEN